LPESSQNLQICCGWGFEGEVMPRRALLALLLVASCAACSASHYAGWNGRRGYDVAAAKAEARRYRQAASRFYPAPGTPGDPWGPYITEAAYRFRVPPQWVRAVMAQESGGRLYDASGGLTTSPVGAMGLMQVMPATYDMLRQRYGLGGDPYDPHNNILAGTAYIREMYDRYGAPGFLAAYNAGPARVDAALADGAALPEETVNYVAAITPRLGAGGAPGGMSAGDPNRAYAGGGMVMSNGYGGAQAVPAYVASAGAYDPDRAYAGGGIVASNSDEAVAADDPSLRAYPGGGLVSAAAPTGYLAAAPVVGPAAVSSTFSPPNFASPNFASPNLATPAIAPPAVAPRGFVAPHLAVVPAVDRGWAIQVGAFPNAATSTAAIDLARARVAELLRGAQPVIIPVRHNGILYRARLTGLSATDAALACLRLADSGVACFTVPPGA
jgi:hypothetical protein